jgi:hypothetical protein
VTSKLGRTLGRPRSRASFLGHPGTSAGEGWARFPPPPGPPPPRTALRGRWPIDADAPWKSHGRHRRTARTEPSTAFSTELGKPANGRRFPTSVNRPAALRRGAFARSLFPNDSDAGDTINPSTQSGQAQTKAVTVNPSLLARPNPRRVRRRERSRAGAEACSAPARGGRGGRGSC